MTKANSILHRAAALLAALCLLASMALPVYAAETETDFSASNSETIPSNDNAENDADETGSDISVSNLETSQKDADTTSEGSKTEPEISVPNSEAITNSRRRAPYRGRDRFREYRPGRQCRCGQDRPGRGKNQSHRRKYLG